MKEQIEKLIDLSRQIDPIQDEISKAVCLRAIEFSKAQQKKYEHQMDFPSSPEFIESWFIDSSGYVNVKWSETWNFGGHARGSFHFLAAFVYDEKAFADYQAECEKIEANRMAKDAESQRQKDLQKFEELKKKLGQQSEAFMDCIFRSWSWRRRHYGNGKT